MSDIRRIYATTTTTIPSGSSLSSTPIDMRRMVGGVLETPATLTAGNFGFKVSSASNGTPLPFFDNDGEIVEIMSASVSTAYRLPSALYQVHYAWVWSQSASGGTDVDQSASRGFTIHLKS